VFCNLFGHPVAAAEEIRGNATLAEIREKLKKRGAAADSSRPYAERGRDGSGFCYTRTASGKCIARAALRRIPKQGGYGRYVRPAVRDGAGFTRHPGLLADVKDADDAGYLTRWCKQGRDR
jgi:hypothetical protein